MRIIITEDQKNEILDKYKDYDPKILDYLKDKFPGQKVKKDSEAEMLGRYRILINGDYEKIKGNFTFLVNLLDNEIKEKFSDVDDKNRRQTIKKYLKSFDI
jgi:hypothetical protein